MKTILRYKAVCLALGLLILSAGCDGGSSSSDNFDYGDNDKEVVLAMGDSITEGRCVPAGAPYPTRLAQLSGKRVVNVGICGERTEEGLARFAATLNRHNPGTVLIFFGANDALFGRNPDGVIANLNGMVDAALANQTRPIIATLLPLYPPRDFANPLAEDYSNRIKTLARDRKIKLVDLRREFGSRRELLLPDGLHPSDAGNQLIALAFNDKVR